MISRFSHTLRRTNIASQAITRLTYCNRAMPAMPPPPRRICAADAAIFNTSMASHDQCRRFTPRRRARHFFCATTPISTFFAPRYYFIPISIRMEYQNRPFIIISPFQSNVRRPASETITTRSRCLIHGHVCSIHACLIMYRKKSSSADFARCRSQSQARAKR